MQDNTLDFLEYVAALHLILRGNLEDRLKWSFKMYDKDGNGKLDRHEVKRLIKVGPSLATTGDRIHASNPGSRNASRCSVSAAATSACLRLPNGLSANRCYVIPVGLGLYLRSWTDPLCFRRVFSFCTLVFLASTLRGSCVTSIRWRQTLVSMAT